MMKPDDSNDLCPLDGGVMGEGGCPSKVEVIDGNLRLSSDCVLAVREYK